MGSEIKYKYALDQNDALVSVEALSKDSLPKGAVFYSLDFHQELIPRLGLVRRKHFAHKKPGEAVGNRETYLHALGKKVFREEYERCLQTNSPFYLEYYRHETCIKLYSEYGLECKLQEGPFKYDLTKYFTVIKEEKGDGDFRPDLLLTNPKRDEKIYIEITVTHKSSDKKLQSGNRIIEYKIADEADVDVIRKSVNGINDKSASLHNFVVKESRGTFCGEGCRIHSFYYFYVAPNGKCKLWDSQNEEGIKQLSTGIPSSHLWQESRPHHRFAYAVTSRNLSHIDVYQYFMAKAVKANIAVKNCFLCKYHADNNSRYYKQEVWKPIWCRKLKKSYRSNDASECEEYTISTDYVEHYLGKGRRQESQ